MGLMRVWWSIEVGEDRKGECKINEKPSLTFSVCTETALNLKEKKKKFNHQGKNSLALVPDLIQHSGCLDTDVNKSASPTAEEQPKETDGPLPGSVNDQEKKASTFRHS